MMVCAMQYTATKGVMTTRMARINLVDMAGIERIQATDHVDKQHLTEGGITNRSLVFFGKCLTSLAERTKAKSKGKTVSSCHVTCTCMLSNAWLGLV
jgi:hypothetical protein